MVKRIFDLVASGLGLLILLPLFLYIAIAIKLDSPGDIFFRQVRVGRHGIDFKIHKFRTMIDKADRQGLAITVGADSRVTSVGKWLRRYKLDELPQLIDVFVGNMSLVGPRPEVPTFVEYYPSASRKTIQSVKPGITDWASIQFKDENEILGKSADPHSTYINDIIPVKIAFYEAYVREQTFLGDLKIIFCTFFALIRKDNSI